MGRKTNIKCLSWVLLALVCASGGYIFNDLFDLTADREHRVNDYDPC